MNRLPVISPVLRFGRELKDFVLEFPAISVIEFKLKIFSRITERKFYLQFKNSDASSKEISCSFSEFGFPHGKAEYRLKRSDFFAAITHHV